MSADAIRTAREWAEQRSEDGDEGQGEGEGKGENENASEGAGVGEETQGEGMDVVPGRVCRHRMRLSMHKMSHSWNLT